MPRMMDDQMKKLPRHYHRQNNVGRGCQKCHIIIIEDSCEERPVDTLLLL